MTEPELREALKRAGFQVRRGEDSYVEARFHAANPALGVIIKYEVRMKDEDGMRVMEDVHWCQKRIRTGYGGYITDFHINDPGMDDVSRLITPGAPKPTNSPLPLPMEARQFGRQIFTSNPIIANSKEGPWVNVELTIATVRVVELVILNNRNQCVAQTGEPEELCWFLLDCMSVAGATFNVITDGDVWMAVDRRSMRVTPNLNPKATVDMAKLNSLDRAVVRKAIQLFLEKI